MNFPSWASLAPILTTPRARQRPNNQMEVGDKVEVEEVNLTQGIGGNHSNPPGL